MTREKKEMEIERINSYEDTRFDKEVLRQHGAFLVDRKYPCSFRIVDRQTAVVSLADNAQIEEHMEELIEEFRFFAEHITRFVDEKGRLVKEYPQVETFELELAQIQPSQFYVDEDKLEAVASFVRVSEDVIIPVMRFQDGDKYISLDGHTRLYCAYQKGIKQVKAFPVEEENDYIPDFVREAEKRGIYTISDMQVLSHEEYAEKWNTYCDEYFASKSCKKNICEEIREKLFEMQDLGYRDFHAKLIPNIDKEKIIGVRTPTLRKYAREAAKEPAIKEFLASLPHRYYDENNLHGFVIEQIRNFDECLEAVDRFLPYVDNWATCDLMAPKVFGKHREELLTAVRRWLTSGETYTIRYGVNMLMRFFLDEDFRPEYLDMVAGIRSEEYYVKMVVAWYFATALAKQYDAVIPFLEQCRLDKWTHNKAIQKARESYRITAEQKEYLNTLKVKL